MNFKTTRCTFTLRWLRCGGGWVHASIHLLIKPLLSTFLTSHIFCSFEKYQEVSKILMNIISTRWARCSTPLPPSCEYGKPGLTSRWKYDISDILSIHGISWYMVYMVTLVVGADNMLFDWSGVCVFCGEEDPPAKAGGGTKQHPAGIWPPHFHLDLHHHHQQHNCQGHHGFYVTIIKVIMQGSIMPCKTRLEEMRQSVREADAGQASRKKVCFIPFFPSY